MQQEIWFQKYRIIRLLGRGGTAEVYLAEHIKLNSYRAIKCISKNHPLYELQRNEALLLKNLKHSCIPIIYDIEEDEEGSYIVEQYLEGDTLKELVKTKGPIKEEAILHYAALLCDVIDYLHHINRPVLYIDLKPENIIIFGMSLKLVDFGSAVYQDELQQHIKYCGTRGYAAPELYRRKQVDERCDVYGIGMLLYYMATGREVDQLSSGICNIDLIRNCSSGLKNLINHCLKFHPAQRYATVEQLKKHLSVLQQKQSIIRELSQPLTISVAGAQPRIGVTHLSLRLCQYFRQQNESCLYIEKNATGDIRLMKNCYEDVMEKSGVFELKQIPMTSGDVAEAILRKYRVTILDYGCLTKNNLEDFLKADRKLLVLGAKDWELIHSEEVLNMTAEYKDIAYLYNFLDGRQFRIVCNSMEQKNCFRLPYEPDPYVRLTNTNGLELFHELLGVRQKLYLKSGRKSLFKMKGSEYNRET